MSNTWNLINLPDFSLFRSLTQLFDTSKIEIFSSISSSEFVRKKSHGIITMRGAVSNLELGLIYHDFRVSGGSFCRENSKRIVAFLNELNKKKTPLLILLNTMGVNLMEGRTVFSPAFSILPALMDYSESNLLITCALGRCLGLGLLIYKLGHYRMGIQRKSFLNLTGPQVMKLFFGEKFHFEQVASSKHHLETTGLVQHIFPSQEEAFQQVRILLNLIKPNQSEANNTTKIKTLSDSKLPGYLEFKKKLLKDGDSSYLLGELNFLLDTIADSHLEIFPQLDHVVQTIICCQESFLFAIIANPIGQANNCITVQSLEKYLSALKFFKILNIPLISILDTPGIDPRPEQMDKNIVEKIIQVSKEIIDYPGLKMGIIAGRCFGGASVLSLPKIFGAKRVIALKNSQVGIMSENIIHNLLQKSPLLLAQWSNTRSQQTPNLTDLQQVGDIDEVIDLQELPRHIFQFVRTSVIE